MPSNYLTAAEAASHLRLSPSLLAKWRHYGRGPTYFKPSSKVVLYKQADLDAWIGTKRMDVAAVQAPRHARSAFSGAPKRRLADTTRRTPLAPTVGAHTSPDQ